MSKVSLEKPPTTVQDGPKQDVTLKAPPAKQEPAPPAKDASAPPKAPVPAKPPSGEVAQPRLLEKFERSLKFEYYQKSDLALKDILEKHRVWVGRRQAAVIKVEQNEPSICFCGPRKPKAAAVESATPEKKTPEKSPPPPPAKPETQKTPESPKK